MSKAEMIKPRPKIKIKRNKGYDWEFYIAEGDEVVDYTLYEIVDGEKPIIGMYYRIDDAPVTGSIISFKYTKTNGEVWYWSREVFPGRTYDIAFHDTVKLEVSAKGLLSGAYTVYSPR